MKRSELKQIIKEELQAVLAERNLAYTKGSDGPKFNFKITIPVVGSLYKYEYSDRDTKEMTDAIKYEASYDEDKMRPIIAKEIEKKLHGVLGKEFTLDGGNAQLIGFEKQFANASYKKG